MQIGNAGDASTTDSHIAYVSTLRQCNASAIDRDDVSLGVCFTIAGFPYNRLQSLERPPSSRGLEEENLKSVLI